MTGSEWDEYADGWDDDPAAGAYAAAAFESLLGLLDDNGVDLEGARVCDFGCGTGLLTDRLVAHAASIDAVDSSPAMLAVLDGKIARHAWTTVRTMAMPSSSAEYDLIVCSSVCGFLDDYARTVAELASTLAPGGWLVQWDWEADPSAPDGDGLSREAIASALTGAGLEAITVDVGFRIPFEGQTMAPLLGAGRMPAA